MIGFTCPRCGATLDDLSAQSAEVLAYILQVVGSEKIADIVRYIAELEQRPSSDEVRHRPQ
jgi:hypothetical protein